MPSLMSTPHPAIRQLETADIAAAVQLIHDVFMEFEAPDFTQEGIDEFLRFIAVDQLASRMDVADIALWGWYEHGRLVGVVGMELRGHVCLLFVDAAFHRRGIARALLAAALHPLRKAGVLRVTVNSSPYAVAAYERLGFVATDDERVFNGIRFVPMSRAVQASGMRSLSRTDDSCTGCLCEHPETESS
ncbi:MAG TPA: N-acetyltransferase [Desulfovibrio sp.]|nr:N-acetyltransferase [Desulfovibrio sp.]